MKTKTKKYFLIALLLMLIVIALASLEATGVVHLVSDDEEQIVTITNDTLVNETELEQVLPETCNMWIEKEDVVKQEYRFGDYNTITGDCFPKRFYSVDTFTYEKKFGNQLWNGETGNALLLVSGYCFKQFSGAIDFSNPNYAEQYLFSGNSFTCYEEMGSMDIDINFTWSDEKRFFDDENLLTLCGAGEGESSRFSIREYTAVGGARVDKYYPNQSMRISGVCTNYLLTRYDIE